MSKLDSTLMTEALLSRPVIAAARPATLAPMTTMSAVQSSGGPQPISFQLSPK